MDQSLRIDQGTGGYDHYAWRTTGPKLRAGVIVIAWSRQRIGHTGRAERRATYFNTRGDRNR
jgi:hypothetical protein